MSRMSKPQVCIVTPAIASANNGNWHTAARWASFLAPQAEVKVAQDWTGAPADALIALHARRSAAAIERFRAAHPDRPLALVLTGTDLYRDLDLDSSARLSLVHATHIVVLQDEALRRLDAESRAKARCIVQSAARIVRADKPARWQMVAIGHLRPEKDPETLMRAVRLLPAHLALDVVHIGNPLDEALADAARRTMKTCALYQWIGGLPATETRERLARAHALVHMSRMEGGANAVIEAIRSDVPVIASRIDGNVGLLGDDYGGYFPAGDAGALAAAMARFVEDEPWRALLQAQCAARSPRFAPERESAAVRGLFADMLQAPKGAATIAPPAVPKDLQP